MCETKQDDSRRPIFFGTVEEFCRRPAFELRMQCDHDDLDSIIGKYSRPRNNQIECGLNGCTSKHMHGYVIRANDGRETNCGKDCGEREFGVKFLEFEAEYKRAEDAHLRRGLLVDILRNRDDLIAQTRSLHASVKVASARISKVMTEVKREPALLRALDSTLRNGGLIRVENKVDEALRRGSADLKTIGEIMGGQSLTQYINLPIDLYYKVLRPLERMDASTLDDLANWELEKKTRELGDLGQTLILAKQFLADEGKFCAPENLLEFSKLKELIPRSARKDRLDRILSKLPTLHT